jgi:hypothetical protein
VPGGCDCCLLPGSASGEYMDAALGLAVLADGSVLLRDARNNRFNL